MEYHVHFPYPQAGVLVNEFEHTLVGNAVVAGFANNFDSVTSLISGSHSNETNGTTVDLPNGNSIDFDNVPLGRFARVARTVGAYFGLRQ